MEPVIFNQEELEEACYKWQQILRLENWDIVLSIERAKNFADLDNQGEIEYRLELGAAAIRILHPDDWPDNTQWVYDMEKTLVHELLHLHFSFFEPEDKKSLNYTLWERTIETLARIIVDLERSGTEIQFALLDEDETKEKTKSSKKSKKKQKE